jgi:hypothetical protein
MSLKVLSMAYTLEASPLRAKDKGLEVMVLTLLR